ncbi:MAG: glutamate racemase [Candidatus Cardinium sp.]|nr:glutamate racemase [Candidatus Cardinium sp.]
MLLLNSICRKEAPIAIYDSGVGGLAIAKALQTILPQESLHYIADTRHLPYGNQTTASLCSYVAQIVNFCLDKQYKLLVIACNTATTAAGYLNATYFINKAIPIINVVEPVIAALCATTADNPIGLIGTTYTVTHGNYSKRLQEKGKSIIALSTPLLATMVEASFVQQPIDARLLQSYLDPLADAAIATLIPACTHYLFLESEIKKIFKTHYHIALNIIDVAGLTALAVKDFLTFHNLLPNSVQQVSHCFMATALTPAFTNATQQLFGQSAITIDLQPYKESVVAITAPYMP